MAENLIKCEKALLEMYTLDITQVHDDFLVNFDTLQIHIRINVLVMIMKPVCCIK